MPLFRVKVRELNMIDWFGGVVVMLLESEHDSTVFIHVCLLVIRISCVSCSSSVRMIVSVGDCVRRKSRWRMRDLAMSERLGMQLGM